MTLWLLSRVIEKLLLPLPELLMPGPSRSSYLSVFVLVIIRVVRMWLVVGVVLARNPA
ncbi:MAG: hypothetical protein J7K46_06905 [Bacteroidales bacterium]|nr:hypothetical protein [Bacteroidales bacterium]